MESVNEKACDNAYLPAHKELQVFPVLVFHQRESPLQFQPKYIKRARLAICQIPEFPILRMNQLPAWNFSTKIKA